LVVGCGIVTIDGRWSVVGQWRLKRRKSKEVLLVDEFFDWNNSSWLEDGSSGGPEGDDGRECSM
jgi:hypothetical protein